MSSRMTSAEIWQYLEENEGKVSCSVSGGLIAMSFDGVAAMDVCEHFGITRAALFAKIQKMEGEGYYIWEDGDGDHVRIGPAFRSGPRPKGRPRTGKDSKLMYEATVPVCSVHLWNYSDEPRTSDARRN